MNARVALLPILTLLTSAIAFAQTAGFKVLYSFTGGADGGTPRASLTIGKGETLYGTTYYGGMYSSGLPGLGTVFLSGGYDINFNNPTTLQEAINSGSGAAGAGSAGAGGGNDCTDPSIACADSLQAARDQ